MMDVVGSERGAPEASGLGSDQPVTAREAVEKMVQAGMLDDLMNQVDSGDLQLTGDGGFLPELVRRVLEAGLAAELTDHLGYERHDRAGHGSGNSRNGFTAKRLGTEVGDLDLATPRDRLGSFEPRLVSKGQRRVGGLSDMIISLYAGGMTIRDIQAHLERTLGTELSHETISNITDAVLEEVRAWQARPLEAVYPIVYFDALVVKVKESHAVRNKAAHIAVGVDTDGIKHVLGIWVQTSEGAKFWAGVLAELRNRGVKEVLIACCDGLTGFPEAIEATWSQTVVQTCVVHLIRASMRFVSYNDRKAVAAALRPIYTAPTEAAAAQELDIFEGSNWGKKYPATVRVWRDAWERFIPFLEFPPAVRKIIYTTDEIVKIVPGCRRGDHPVSVWLLASRGSSTAGPLRRSAGAVKMERPTGRTILTAPSTGTSSKPEEPAPPRMPLSNRCLGAGRLGGLPVRDEDLVGPLGLLRELFLFVASLLVVIGSARSAIVAAPGGCASSELEFAPFVRHQAGSGEGVVLIFGHQMPRQHGHLAGGGDDGGLEAAAGLDALEERPQRPGGAAGRPGRLDQHTADLRPTRLADPTVHRCRVPRLTDLRVQPHIGHEPVGIWEATEVPDRGHNRHAGDRVHPGNGHQPGNHRIGQGLGGQLLVHHRQLAAVEVQLPQQRLHAGAFIGRQRLHRQPVPAGPAEQIRHRRGRGQVARQDRMDLVLDPGPLPNQMRAAGNLPTQRTGPIIRQPHRRQEVRRQQLGKDPGIDLVGLDLRLRDRPRLGRV
jgi:putative transposase